MDSVIDTVLFRNDWNLWDLAVLKCVNNSCKQAVESIFEYESKLLSDKLNDSVGKEVFCEKTKAKSQCNKCGEKTYTYYPFSLGKMHCADCREIYQITKTEAKKSYKLTDQDLYKLDFSTGVHFLYGTHITYYSRKQVVALSLLKHGGNLPKKKKNTISNVKEKRKKQITNLQNKYGDVALYNTILYELNGKGGIKRLESIMKRESELLR